MLLIFKQSIVGKKHKKILKPLTDSSYLYLYQQRQELCMNFLRFYAIKTFWWSNKNGLRKKQYQDYIVSPPGIEPGSAV